MLKHGILAGAAQIGWLLLFYFVDKKLMLSPQVIWGGLVFYLLGMVLACRSEAKSFSEPYPWQASLRTTFGVFLIISAMYYTFNYLLFRFIDPGLVDLQRDLTAQGLEQYRNWFGEGNAWQLKESLRKENFEPKLGAYLFSFVFSLLRGFPLCLIVAYIMRGK
jgi:Protein of unknown function (DUF4199)